MADYPKIATFYAKHYKKIFFIPIILVLAALGIILYTYLTTGDFIEKDVSLKGGVTATVYTEKEMTNLEEMLQKRFPSGDIEVRILTEFGTEKQTGVLIEASNVEEKELTEELAKNFDLKLTEENYSVETVGSSLGAEFYSQMMVAMGLAFLFMAIVVFIIFRTPIPSLAVIFAAFSDVTVTIAVLNLAGIKVSTAGISALLLLIGYSIDTDILLTTKALKRREEGGTTIERMIDGALTGLTMTFTSIGAVTVGYFVSSSDVIQQMFFIIIIGLLTDIIATYGMNAGLLLWYTRRKYGD